MEMKSSWGGGKDPEIGTTFISIFSNLTSVCFQRNSVLIQFCRALKKAIPRVTWLRWHDSCCIGTILHKPCLVCETLSQLQQIPFFPWKGNDENEPTSTTQNDEIEVLQSTLSSTVCWARHLSAFPSRSIGLVSKAHWSGPGQIMNSGHQRLSWRFSNDSSA